MSKNKITAVLGPTNTGKTFLAIDTMLSFDSGMIGFPLRLLAREVYDKVIKKIDASKVALITGEEKIIPLNAKYFLCTVESMPVDKILDFVGIDEIQMCSDNERGHIFTERLLNLRGEKLTMLMGSNTIKKIIKNLDDDIEFVNKDRFSKLSFSGYKKISRIERKSAVIAFSTEEVYAIAELIRRQKGGAAIVMGSLSPKTRNAQVNLYQSGDVDYLVATDAIGMGINMDLNHIYFSNIKKFDGKKIRRLKINEIGQIAGRAGRYLNDGNFGVTGNCEEINPEEIEFLENHKFPEIQSIYWRNSKLNFNNKIGLINSLDERPNKEWLKRIGECEDEKVLKYFLKEKGDKIEDKSETLKILWECCQIPDFVKKTYGHHIEVVDRVFNFLISYEKKIPNHYMKKQLSFLDNLDGNVDSISNRISNVRTWSYVSNKSNWVENQDFWIARTKDLEDKLSDKLHEELTKTFIDKRASVLAKGLKQDIEFKTEIINNKNVLINSQYIGELRGLKLNLDLKVDALDADIKSLKKAARQNVTPEIIDRISQIVETGLVELKEDFKIYWRNEAIAKLVPGSDYLNPKINLIIDEMIEKEDKNKLSEFLNKWVEKKITTELNNLIELKNIKDQNPELRALAYRLYENNGVIKRSSISDYLNKLNQSDRGKLRKLGVKFGRYHIFLFKLFKPSSVSLRILLWKCYNNKFLDFAPPTFGLNFLDRMGTANKEFMLLCGFEKFNDLFVRIDILERLFLIIFKSDSDSKREIKVTPEMLNLLGCTKQNFIKLLKQMNYKIYERDKDFYLKYLPTKKVVNKKKDKKDYSNNPFLVLNQLDLK